MSGINYLVQNYHFMLYPDHLLRINQELQLYVPDPELLKDSYSQAVANDPSVPFPFWARIWPSARALTTFLVSEPGWVKGKNVFELGAGIGLPSFSIASYTAKLHITDHAPEAVDLMNKNIGMLKLENVQATVMDWNDIPLGLVPDVVLLSDVNYAPAEFASLQVSIERLLNLGTLIILATPQRIMGVPFLNALQQYIKQSAQYSISENGEEIPVSIFILSLNR